MGRLVEVVAAADERAAILERRVPAAHARGMLCFASRQQPVRPGARRPAFARKDRVLLCWAAVLGGCWAGAGRVLGGGRTQAPLPWLA